MERSDRFGLHLFQSALKLPVKLPEVYFFEVIFTFNNMSSLIIELFLLIKN